MKFHNVLVALFLLAAPMVQAQTVQPYATPTGFTAQSNLHIGSNGRPEQLYATAPDANWHVAMMGEPEDPVVQNSANGLPLSSWTWGVSWGSAVVTRNAGGFAVRLIYAGEHAACGKAFGMIPEEHDQGIEPNPNAVQAPYRTNRDFPMLNRLGSLKVSGIVSIVSVRQAAGDSPCNVNHAGFNYGVTLVNTVSNQMFWYALQLGHVCEPGKDFASCQAGSQHPKPVVYWHGSDHMTGRIANYAETDVMASFNQMMLTGPGTLNFSVDVLPHLATMITAGQSGIDPDLSHWRVAGIGAQTTNWGRVDLVTDWQGLTLNWAIR